METIGGRIKTIRTLNKLTQVAFGSKIGIKGNTVAQIEMGSRNPSTLVLNAIIDKFAISREWLLTGEGDMYPPLEDRDIDIVTRAMEGSSENKKKLMRLLAEMPDELLDKMVEYLEGKKK